MSLNLFALLAATCNFKRKEEMRPGRKHIKDETEE